MRALIFVYIIEEVAHAHVQYAPLKWFSSTPGLGVVPRLLRLQWNSKHLVACKELGIKGLNHNLRYPDQPFFGVKYLLKAVWCKPVLYEALKGEIILLGAQTNLYW